jgi:hypothetical protein
VVDGDDPDSPEPPGGERGFGDDGGVVMRAVGEPLRRARGST